MGAAPCVLTWNATGRGAWFQGARARAPTGNTARAPAVALDTIPIAAALVAHRRLLARADRAARRSACLPRLRREHARSRDRGARGADLLHFRRWSTRRAGVVGGRTSRARRGGPSAGGRSQLQHQARRRRGPRARAGVVRAFSVASSGEVQFAGERAHGRRWQGRAHGARCLVRPGSWPTGRRARVLRRVCCSVSAAAISCSRCGRRSRSPCVSSTTRANPWATPTSR
jgi:hypothetical protein